MHFIETPIFTSVIAKLLGREEYRSLQIALMLRPEQGPIVKGGGGLRKIRWAKKGVGKRGGVRVIYYWYPQEEIIYMLYAYSKADQGDLSRAQLHTLARIVREELP